MIDFISDLDRLLKFTFTGGDSAPTVVQLPKPDLFVKTILCANAVTRSRGELHTVRVRQFEQTVAHTLSSVGQRW